MFAASSNVAMTTRLQITRDLVPYFDFRLRVVLCLYFAYFVCVCLLKFGPLCFCKCELIAWTYYYFTSPSCLVDSVYFLCLCVCKFCFCHLTEHMFLSLYFPPPIINSHVSNFPLLAALLQATEKYTANKAKLRCSNSWVRWFTICDVAINKWLVNGRVKTLITTGMLLRKVFEFHFKFDF